MYYYNYYKYYYLTCGIVVIHDLRSLKPIVAISIPSIMIAPCTDSIYTE